MKRAVLGLAVALLLGACGQVKQETEMRMDLLDIRSVEFPPSVVADEPLNIIVEIGRACDRAFGQFRATRTATALDLQAFTKTYAVSAPVPPCPPVIILEKHTYTDPGTPTRTDPFEVIVNGKSYGTVNIK